MMFLIFSAIILAAAAQEMYVEPYEGYPEWYISSPQRHRRDVTLDRKMGDGRVYGTLGQNDNGLFGKAGYDHQIFNDGRGKLTGGVSGTRVLGPYGDSSHLGGGLNWQNSNAAASLDVSKQIHGPTSWNAGAGGRWPVGKNGDFSLQGTYGKTSGMRPQFGGMGNFNYRF
ncbi:gloverin-like [Aricia agestis]|uniref:gloverin-like n=1 Tax=Aricia agestis TaxID=91739 RepID=UPI001C20BDDC|nr:gloverin-like [Aricia agestis]XP_041977067.1 gloverin-like [Aricia agestis]